MDTINSLISGGLRFVLPVLAILVIFTCVISLFRNRPRLHKLAQLVDQKDGTVIDIDRWETSIGKSKSNDVVLKNDTVSRYHAVIAKKRNEWVITDTFSKTGVFVNGEEIDSQAVIEDADVITVGDVSLKFLCAEALSQASKAQI